MGQDKERRRVSRLHKCVLAHFFPTMQSRILWRPDLTSALELALPQRQCRCRRPARSASQPLLKCCSARYSPARTGKGVRNARSTKAQSRPGKRSSANRPAQSGAPAPVLIRSAQGDGGAPPRLARPLLCAPF